MGTLLEGGGGRLGPIGRAGCEAGEGLGSELCQNLGKKSKKEEDSASLTGVFTGGCGWTGRGA